MLVLTFIVWVVLYARRLPMLSKSDADLKKLTKKQLAEMSPPYVTHPAENFINLFELPVLFYALVLYLYTTSSVDSFYLVAAWVFAGARYLHSFIHCTGNPVTLRFACYVISSVALWLMIFRAAWQLL